ncbi:hypothetical protein ACSDR0_18310 [Streptosporangium sp. G11]|uniref:hypothetical protein n=1 Tax=Streptosporangium sp. G11 TaxID=3436926 RepID=UPI003EBEFE2C
MTVMMPSVDHSIGAAVTRILRKTRGDDKEFLPERLTAADRNRRQEWPVGRSRSTHPGGSGLSDTKSGRAQVK